MSTLTSLGDATQPPDPAPTYWSYEIEAAPYTVYDIVFSYEGDAGVRQMAVCGLPTAQQVGALGPGTTAVPCELPQIAAPWMLVRANWKAVRSGLPCTLPDWRPPSQSSKYVLRSWRISGKDPMLGTDGVTYRFMVTGEVVYYLRVPLTPNDGYPMAAAPYQVLPTAVMGITFAQFNPTIFPL